MRAVGPLSAKRVDENGARVVGRPGRAGFWRNTSFWQGLNTGAPRGRAVFAILARRMRAILLLAETTKAKRSTFAASVRCVRASARQEPTLDDKNATQGRTMAFRLAWAKDQAVH